MGVSWPWVAAGGAALAGVTWLILKLNDRLGEMSPGSRDAFWNREVLWPPLWYRHAHRSYFTVDRIVHEATLLLIFASPVLFFLKPSPLLWFALIPALVLFRVAGPRFIWERMPAAIRTVLPLEPVSGPVPAAVPKTYRQLLQLLKTPRAAD
jgi:hypothetical protein